MAVSILIICGLGSHHIFVRCLIWCCPIFSNQHIIVPPTVYVCIVLAVSILKVISCVLPWTAYYCTVINMLLPQNWFYVDGPTKKDCKWMNHIKTLKMFNQFFLSPICGPLWESYYQLSLQNLIKQLSCSTLIVKLSTLVINSLVNSCYQLSYTTLVINS